MQFDTMDPLEVAATITVDGPHQEDAETAVVEALDFDIGYWDKDTKSYQDVELDRDPRYSAPWAVAVWDMLPDAKQCAIMDKLERAKAEEPKCRI